MYKVKILLVCALLPFFSTRALAADDPHNFYVLAERSYRLKNFSQALQEYNRALQSAPAGNKAVIHYMKGNCLTQLNQPVGADEEYASAQLLAPGSQTAAYCAQARANLRRSTKAPNSAPQTAKSSDSNDDEEDDNDAPKTAVPTAQEKAVSPATLDLIGKQAALAQKRTLDVGNIAAENERIKAANEARSLQSRLERAASTPKNGSTEPVALTPAQLEAIKSQAAAGSEQLKQAGEWKAQQRKQESEDKAEEIRRQAENLQSQLINYRPNINSDIKLNPVGTNLYIRNYSNGMKPIMPVKAETGALPSYKSATEGIKGAVMSKQTSLKKIDERGTTGTTSSSIDVKGKLIGRPRSTQAEHP